MFANQVSVVHAEPDPDMKVPSPRFAKKPVSAQASTNVKEWFQSSCCQPTSNASALEDSLYFSRPKHAVQLTSADHVSSSLSASIHRL